MGRFEKDGSVRASEGGDQFGFAVAFFYRKESTKSEEIGSKPSASESGEDRGRSREDLVGNSGCETSLEEALARVRDRWHAGVRDQGNRAAFAESLDELFAAGGLVVLVEADPRDARDLVVVQQSARVARVFAGDDVDGTEAVERPDGDIAKVADRGGDKVEGARRC